MAFDRFLIAPINDGLQTDLRPWLIPDSAWEQLENAYVFRGRVRKRFGATVTGGTTLNSRLSIPLGNTDGAGTLAGTVPGNIFAVGQQFSIGTEVFTVITAGVAQVMLSSTGVSATHTYSTTNGAFSFIGAAHNTQVYFYPSTPVMGLVQYEAGMANNHASIAFDTQFAYVFSGNKWIQSPSAPDPTPIFNGTNSQFFWGANWQSVTSSQVCLFVSNFNVNIGLGLLTDDPIWSYNGADWLPFSYSPNVALTGANNYQPYTVTQATTTTGIAIKNYVQSALIIVAFKNRLLLLNTIENNANGAAAFDPANKLTTGVTPTNYQTSTNTQYPWRCRYSQYGGPFAPNAWLEQNQVYVPTLAGTLYNAAGGGYVDAATEESIVSAEFIKDRLIVYFERSTWELVYSGNEIQPFNWQKINTELGSESTFSIVPFDKIVMAVGETGVHACNGSNVERIDSKIPDQIFTLRSVNNAITRVNGIRDYYTEMVYWTFPSDSFTTTGVNDVYPNQVLVYNYKTGSWAINDDSITCFGYFEQASGITWASTTETWEQANFAWNSGVVQADFRQIIAGNQQGFVFIINPDVSRNAPVLQITNITLGYPTNLQIINHNIAEQTYILIENVTGTVGLNGSIYAIAGIVDVNNITIDVDTTGSGAYTGAGTVTLVSQINMTSKQWNPYVGKDTDVYLAKIDFGVQRTAAGQVTVDYYPSSTALSLLTEGENSGAILGTGILETSPYPGVALEALQTRLWHPIYFQGEGECIQINISLSIDQMTNTDSALSDFELEGMVLFTTPTSSRLG